MSGLSFGGDTAVERQNGSTDAAPRHHCITWHAFAIVAVYAAVLLLVHFGPTRVLNHHEVIFAQPAREMIATGNWLVPHFSGVPCTYKPPGTNWLIAIAMLLTGSQAEWAVRLPTALAGIATALIITAMAARWFGSRIAVVAGLIQASSYYVLLLSHTAEADMLLSMFVSAAMFCFAAGNVHSPRGLVEARWLPWLFYLMVTCAFLIKALMGVYVILGGCSAFVLVTKDWRGLRFLLNPFGLGVFLTCSGAWCVAAFVEYPQYLDTQILHHVGRLKGEMGRNGSPLFYLLATLLMTLPWTPLILVGVIGGMRQRFWRAALWRFVACWFVVGITLLVVCPFQRKHYLAPLLPPLSFVAAISLLGYVRLRITNSFAMHLIQGIAVMTACSSAAAVVTIIQPRQWTTILALISILSAGSLCTAFFLLRRQPRATLVSIFAAALVVIVGATSFVLPAHDSYRDLADLGRRANRLCPQGTTVYFFGLPDSSITYYLDHPTIRLDHPGKLESGLPRTRGTVYLFTPADQQRYLEPFGTVTQLDQCSSLQRHLPPEQRRLFVRLELREKRLAKRGDGVHSDGEMDK